MRLSLARIAAATGGRLIGGAEPDLVVDGPAVVDSRRVVPGCLFVALAGEHADGHDFAPAALAAGALAVLATREVGGPAVLVDDVLTALGALGRDWAGHLSSGGTTVVGVTGSAGKTGTKDLLSQVLAAAGRTVAGVGSYNNEVGVPLTVLGASSDTRFLVVEMGARGPGHIAHLCRIARPTVGVVLNVGSAHLGEFGSLAATAQAKGELVQALPVPGIAVLNVDDPLVAAMADRTRAEVVWFGRSAGAQVRADDVTLDRSRPAFTLVTPEGSARVRLRLYGEHHVVAALATAAVAREAGLGVQQVADALGRAEGSSGGRMQVRLRPDGVTVVNDAYNANPESMRAALAALVALGRGARTWAVLGEMLELGPSSAAEHEALGRLAAQLGVTRVVAVGEGARGVHLGASQEGSWREEPVFVPDGQVALALLTEQARPGDVVLFKSSNAVGLSAVADAFLAGEGPAGAAE